MCKCPEGKNVWSIRGNVLSGGKEEFSKIAEVCNYRSGRAILIFW